MNSSTKSIDFVIMANAEEESRLAELLADYTQAHPSMDALVAREALTIRLRELLTTAKIGMYEMPLQGRSRPYRDLSLDEALAVVAAPEQWAWEPPPGAQAIYALFDIDPTYAAE